MYGIVDDAYLTSIASAIRSKAGTSDTYTLSQMAAAIESITGGGGSTNVLSGSSIPTAADGSNGDIWIYYTAAYINLTGGAYLETGIVPSTDWGFEVVAYIPDRNTALSNGRWPAFWSIDNSTEAFYCIQNMYQDRSGIIEYAAGNSAKMSQSGAYKYQEINRVSIRNHSFYIGETFIGTNGSGGMQAGNQLLFFGGNVEYKENFTGRIYSAKMWDSNDNLVISLVPDSSGGMLDLVSGNVFPFTGSGNSYVSGDAGVIQSIYLKVNGAWIDIIGQDIDDVDTGGGGTPVTSNNDILFHFDSDMKNSGKATAAFADMKGCVLSDEQSKFGTHSLKVSSSPDYTGAVFLDMDFSFGTDDFTLDFWTYPTTVASSACVFSFNYRSFGYYMYSATKRGLTLASSPSTWAVTHGDIASQTSITNGWHHIAITRASGTVRVFVDGVKEDEVSFASSIAATTKLSFGTNSRDNNIWRGYIDEFRVLLGTAVWTADFTPPTQPYA